MTPEERYSRAMYLLYELEFESYEDTMDILITAITKRKMMYEVQV